MCVCVCVYFYGSRDALLVSFQPCGPHLNGRCDSLLIPAQAFALSPAHGLQHLVADVVAVQPVLRGLLIVPVAPENQVSKNSLENKNKIPSNTQNN